MSTEEQHKWLEEHKKKIKFRGKLGEQTEQYVRYR